MFRFSPFVFFISLLCVMAIVWTLHRVMRHAHKKQLRSLASQWGMQYAQRDLFNLAARVAAEFPIVGVADLVIRDMIYATQGDRHRYVFTAEYTLGVIDRHRREARAVTFCDPRDSGGQCATPLILAPEELSLIEQYRQLSKTWQPHGESD
ncbi:MAG TPA: hypothetical protein VGP99_07880 [Tepidisphaeraceae bacterium]|jgi:hypothetical protein|nr:hypothetical protein [Tepidisphaeraceae bacterium]